MHPELTGRKIAVLVADGFELGELTDLKRVLTAVGARCTIVSLTPGNVQSWEHDHVGASFPVDAAVGTVSAMDFHALLLPGAVLNPDALRDSTDVATFVRGFFRGGKPVAAISLGLQGLLGAGVVRGRTVTSFPSVRADLVGAGAHWVDAAVVVDHGLVTSRSPADLDDFADRMIATFAAPAKAS